MFWWTSVCVWENVFDEEERMEEGVMGGGGGGECVCVWENEKRWRKTRGRRRGPCLPPSLLFLLHVPLLTLPSLFLSPSHLPSPSIPPFQMNTSSVHSTGALLLEPMNQLVIEVKMVHKAAIPLTYDTPAEKLKCKLTHSCSFQHHFKFTIVSRKNV